MLTSAPEEIGSPDDSLPEALPAAERFAAPSSDPARSMFGRFSERFLGVVILLAAFGCSVFVFVQMRPDLLFSSTTPSGGDMGAHVWGPAFMRDHLLSSGRLTGWTPDWYAGFPAYQYYMVIPSLAILILNAGLSLWIGLPLAALALGLTYRAVVKFPQHRVVLWTAGGFAAALLAGFSYGSSFKLISVTGIVGMPMAAYALGRLSKSPDPVPAFLAFGTTIFLFDTNFTIYGGNIASTLAGEFAFSISLALGLLAIGLAMRGMDTGSGRAGAAVIIALVALSHIIPLFFVVLALVLVTILDPALPRWWIIAAGITIGLVPLSQAEGSSPILFVAALATLVVVLGAIAASEASVRKRMAWLSITGPIAALLSTFWLIPFALRSAYFNDMGWERLNDVGPALLTNPMKVALPVAAVGVLFSFGTRDRIGMLFSILALTSASAVANLADGKLWNARILPFYYLSVYVVAAVAIAHVVRFSAATVSERLDAPDRRALVGATAMGLVATLGVISLPLRILPFDQQQADGTYRLFGVTTSAKSFVPGWVAWNYSGYEQKNSFREYRNVVSTMDQLGSNIGCGRAMWEYSKELDRYGTPMALMLLPHWTDGCIGSMEGLYFESSATTPFHFLNQSALSTSPSRAQRDLPYKSFDINLGVSQLKIMGVRYYMAQSDEAIQAARGHADLTEVAISEPFVVFEVAGSEIVEGLNFEPVVATGLSEESAGELASRFDVGWVSQAVTFYNDPDQYLAMPAEGGPSEWQRVSSLSPADGTAVDAAVVSDIVVGTDQVEFKVDRIGVPVVVKVSYFPNWSVSGAEGPWRIGPNLMVVVPTDNEVRLSYGDTGVEYLGYVLTLLGVTGLFAVGRRVVSSTATTQPVVTNRHRTASEGAAAMSTKPKDSADIDDVATPEEEVAPDGMEGAKPEAPSSQ